MCLNRFLTLDTVKFREDDSSRGGEPLTAGIILPALAWSLVWTLNIVINSGLTLPIFRGIIYT